MSSGAGAIAGSGRAGGSVDHRLNRARVLADFRKGRVARTEVCDAHPELRRAAQHYSRPTSEACPICAEDGIDESLVLVTYAFGPHLPPQGKIIGDRADMNRVKRLTPHATCYVVEVCARCGWNHLLKTVEVPGRRSESADSSR